ncbi:DUF2971 domain-containing protein [Dyadobacter psychrotolerans]|jgi:hypothetical protein|uniref:DUF2971 domain-containing protein n=1 Tax=Dyadobacter psychrotolerans TaxID=2541721 RepID=A0A4R5DCR8_9BACT|nr:DUF2971 domain-containing protein [Dyadobacter psychrotolerans]TDE09790.1 DUF2971 domain-containing protein [Dyadobacter psychrotolerans]
MTPPPLEQPRYVTGRSEHLPVGGYPPKIYKYRDWKEQYHDEIITKKQIHFARAIKFPDKFDCRFPILFDFSFETVLEAYKGKITKQIESEGIRPNRDNIIRRVQLIYDECYGTDEKQEKRKKEYYSLIADKTYVFSAAKSCDSIRMWDGYADNLSGFCVEFDFEQIAPLIPVNLISGGHVRYISDPGYKLTHHFLNGEQPELRAKLFNELLIDAFTFKFKEYEFENELRFIKHDWTDDLGLLPHYKELIPTFNDKLDIPLSAYTGIIFGENIDPKHLDEIKIECEKQGLNVTYKMAYRNGDTIEIRPL